MRHFGKRSCKDYRLDLIPGFLRNENSSMNPGYSNCVLAMMISHTKILQHLSATLNQWDRVALCRVPIPLTRYVFLSAGLSRSTWKVQLSIRLLWVFLLSVHCSLKVSVIM